MPTSEASFAADAYSASCPSRQCRQILSLYSFTMHNLLLKSTKYLCSVEEYYCLQMNTVCIPYCYMETPPCNSSRTVFDVLPRRAVNAAKQAHSCGLSFLPALLTTHIPETLDSMFRAVQLLICCQKSSRCFWSMSSLGWCTAGAMVPTTSWGLGPQACSLALSGWMLCGRNLLCRLLLPSTTVLL